MSAPIEVSEPLYQFLLFVHTNSAISTETLDVARGLYADHYDVEELHEMLDEYADDENGISVRALEQELDDLVLDLGPEFPLAELIAHRVDEEG